MVTSMLLCAQLAEALPAAGLTLRVLGTNTLEIQLRPGEDQGIATAYDLAHVHYSSLNACLRHHKHHPKSRAKLVCTSRRTWSPTC